MTISARKEHVCSKRLCYNCFRPDHAARHCSHGYCRTCQGKHHTLLHIEASTEAQAATATESGKENQ